jgi:hypothetical protein
MLSGQILPGGTKAAGDHCMQNLTSPKSIPHFHYFQGLLAGEFWVGWDASSPKFRLHLNYS